MARLFTGASNDIAANTTAAPVSAVPLTMAGWARLAAVGAVTRILCEIRDKDNATSQRAGWRLEMNASERVSARTSNTTTTASVSNSSAALTAGNWAHVGAIFAANNSRVACINGNVSAANTTSISPASVDCVLLGAGLISTSTVNLPWNGDLAEWAIWDAALDAAEMASLAAGVSPLLVRPGNLICYFPLIGNDSPETDIVGRFDLSLTGTAKADHPRILRPSARILQFPSAAGPVDITGTASITEADDTVSAAGVLPIVGTGAATDAADTSAAAGVVLVVGTGAATEDADTVAAAGLVNPGRLGTADITEAADTLASAGTVTGDGASLPAIGWPLPYVLLEDQRKPDAKPITPITGRARIVEGDDYVDAFGDVERAGEAFVREADDVADGRIRITTCAYLRVIEGDDIPCALGRVYDPPPPPDPAPTSGAVSLAQFREHQQRTRKRALIGLLKASTRRA